MIRFGSRNLFASGPARCHPGGLSLRHVLHQAPDALGVSLSPLGHHGRAITQRGDLLADSPAELDLQTQAIEAMLDGRIATLQDDLHRLWPQCVMLAFHPGPPLRLGRRWRLAYRIEYLQLVP